MSVSIERDARLADSIIWEMQKDFFDKKGVSAWDHQVPFYITSNPVIANSYANMSFAFMLDYLNNLNNLLQNLLIFFQ